MAEEETPEPVTPEAEPETPKKPEAPATEEKAIKVEVDTSDLKAELAKTNAKLDAVLDKFAKSEAEPELAEPEAPAEPETPAEPEATEGAVPAEPEANDTVEGYDGMISESGGVNGSAMYLEQESWPATLQPSSSAVAMAEKVGGPE